MTEKKRIGRNIGRIELRAVQDKVQSLLEAGYDRKKIYDRLVEEGCVTMSYPTFCYQLKQLVGSASAAASPGQNQRPKPAVSPKVDPTEPFSINRNPKAEDLIGVKK
ncbi:TraK family protein [Deltaproteobacteria bacterium OttesenSCG-928-K17]|nr:TraK family protein [Deltaproteobacteria bacterium OttesenSCG-928-K17]